MKSRISRNIRLTLLLITLLISWRIDAKEIFADLVEENQVESTFISGNILPLNGGLSNFAPNLRIASGTDDISEVYIYDCRNSTSVEKARRILDNYISRNKDIKLEMRKRSFQQNYEMYKATDTDGNNQELIIWNQNGPVACQIIVIEWD